MQDSEDWWLVSLWGRLDGSPHCLVFIALKDYLPNKLCQLTNSINKPVTRRKKNKPKK